MTKQDILKKIKAGLLAGAIGTTLAGTTTTLTSCTPEEQEFIDDILDESKAEKKRNEETEEKNRQDAEKEAAYQATNTTTVEAIGDNMGTETTTVENTTNEEQPVQTSANTNAETPSKTTTNGGSYTPTTTQVQVPVTTKAQTTAKTTTTTKKTTTTTTTAKPIVTTTTTTTAPTYEYKLENITQSADVFNYFADQLNNEILQGTDTQLRHLSSGEKYWTNGKNESKVALLLLNENEIYAPGVLTQIFNEYTTQDFEDGIFYISIMTTYQHYFNNKYVDFNKYSINDEVAEYLNDIEYTWQNAIENDDCTELDIKMDEFFNKEISSKSAPYYYTIGITDICATADYSYCFEQNEMVASSSKTQEQIKKMIK